MLDLVAVSGSLGREGGAAPGGEGRNVDHFCVRIEPFDEAALVAHLEGSAWSRRFPRKSASAPRATAGRCTSSIRTAIEWS